LCGADRAIIFRFDGEVLRVAAAFNAPQTLMDWLQGRPVIILNTDHCCYLLRIEWRRGKGPCGWL
jgi:hypothetical protein